MKKRVELDCLAADALLEKALAGGKVKAGKTSFRQQVYDLYPRMRELVEKKGYSRKQLYELFKDAFPDFTLTFGTFISYYNNAMEDNRRREERNAVSPTP